MGIKKSKNINYRFERKFLVNELSKSNIENIIKLNSGLLKHSYPERWVNNIYFDSLEFSNYLDNVVGNMYRSKYRIRWYGNLFGKIHNPILEMKVKKGLNGHKISSNLIPFELFKGINISNIEEVLKNSDLDPRIKFNVLNLKPVILNRYRRQYFENHDKNLRVTIDDSQSFYKLMCFNNRFNTKHHDKKTVIVEIKYNQEYDDEAAFISNQFPFRLSKSSKYTRGIDLFYKP